MDVTGFSTVSDGHVYTYWRKREKRKPENAWAVLYCDNPEIGDQLLCKLTEVVYPEFREPSPEQTKKDRIDEDDWEPCDFNDFETCKDRVHERARDGVCILNSWKDTSSVSVKGDVSVVVEIDGRATDRRQNITAREYTLTVNDNRYHFVRLLPHGGELHSAYFTRYRDVRKIGGGSFGTVHEAIDMATLRMCAVKRAALNSFAYDEGNQVMLIEEILLHERMEHENVIAFLDAYTEQPVHGHYWSGTSYIVTEMARGGDLAKHLVKFKKGVSESFALRAFRQIASGLAYMHFMRVMHNDLKPSNVLLMSDPVTYPGFVVKLADFGLSHDPTVPRNSRYPAGCLTFRAPEMVRGGRGYTGLKSELTFKADVWSVGVMLMRCLANRLPYSCKREALREQAMVMNIYTVYHWIQLYAHKGLLLQLQHFMRRCLEVDAEKRATAEELAWLL